MDLIEELLLIELHERTKHYSSVEYVQGHEDMDLLNIGGL